MSLVFALINGAPAAAQQSPADTGTPQVQVSHAGGKWTIAGKKNVVELNDQNLAVDVHSGPVVWKMVPSSNEDMLVAAAGDQFRVRLADAGKIKITPYETGYKTGVKIVLDHFRNTGIREAGALLDLRRVVTMCLEGE